MFKKATGPVDEASGQILDANGTSLAMVNGSWMDKLTIDNELMWTLETTNCYRPILPQTCLPSDCRYREDSIIFGEGDLHKSQKEKERLEILQRKDRKNRDDCIKQREKLGIKFVKNL